MNIKKALGKFVLFLLRWKSSYPDQYQFPKMLLIAAPHTSHWDWIYAMAGYWANDIYPRFLVYHTYMKGLRGFLMRNMGGIGVDPKNKELSIVDFSVDLFNNHSKMALIISPEGSMYKVDKWRTGFFHIATKAEVPVSLCFLDYKNKKAGIGTFLNMSGNFEKDMTFVEKFYSNSNPKHIDRYNPKIF